MPCRPVCPVCPVAPAGAAGSGRATCHSLKHYANIMQGVPQQWCPCKESHLSCNHCHHFVDKAMFAYLMFR